ncbi:DUF6210 family protein [Polyangium sp. y55x31]|uniref:DUF6210 family protein n=1 Tax=Polyangium sp. y55x31 TaxID=3042688 RepID=UPI00248283E0|nr:DUF6210 family protein [Polyangium sp. y55x31]MDI1476865.1 hypothetical protein [Polyangium sp. y55x31]
MFVPFDAEESWLRLSAHFEGPKYWGSGAMRGIDEDDAAFIELVLREGRIRSARRTAAHPQVVRQMKERLCSDHEAI